MLAFFDEFLTGNFYLLIKRILAFHKKKEKHIKNIIKLKNKGSSSMIYENNKIMFMLLNNMQFIYTNELIQRI